MIKGQSKTYMNLLKKVGWKQKLRIYNYNRAHNEFYSPYPLSAKIEINGTCNLDCVMCLRTSLKNREKYMTLTNFKRILDHIPSIVEWSPHGYGEPMLHPLFFDFVEETNKRGILLTLVTNGTLLSERKIRRLLKLKPRQIIVSIDGVNEKYESIRRGASYSIVKKNLERLSENIKETKTVFSLYATIWKDNVDQIPKLVELAEELERGISFSDITWSYQYLDSKYDNSIREHWGDQEIKDYVRKYDGHPLVSMTLGKLKKRSCTLPWSSVYVDVVGDVYPCTDNLDVKMGNVISTPMSEIYNNEKYKNFRTKSLHGKRDICKKCQSWAPYQP